MHLEGPKVIKPIDERSGLSPASGSIGDGPLDWTDADFRDPKATCFPGFRRSEARLFSRPGRIRGVKKSLAGLPKCVQELLDE
jgi:hypothetical protein